MLCLGFLGQWMTAEVTLMPGWAQNNGMCLHSSQGTHPVAVPQPAPLCVIQHRKEKQKLSFRYFAHTFGQKKVNPKRAGISQYVPNRILWGILLSHKLFCLCMLSLSVVQLNAPHTSVSLSTSPSHSHLKCHQISGVIQVGDFSAWGQNKEKHLSWAELQFTSAVVLSQAGKT